MTAPAGLPPPPAAEGRRHKVRVGIRGRITVVTAAAVLVALVLIAVGLLWALRGALVRSVDRTLQTESRLLEARVDRGAAFSLPGRPDVIAQIVGPDGAVLESSSAATRDESDQPLLGSPLPFAAGSGVHTLTVTEPGLGDLRVRATPLDGGRWLVVARSQDQANGAVRTVTRSLIVIVPLITGGLALVVWWGVGRALRPIDAMSSTVDQITEEDLGRRVPESGTGDEVDHLAHTMNAMLGRLDAASGRERQLVADASHELRSPLAAVRALVETRPLAPDPAAHDAEALAAIERLQRLVDQLLELASQDADVPLTTRPVDLDDLVLERADLLRRTTGLTVETTAVSAGQVLGSEDALRRVVENLTSNAARHARSTVRYAVREQGGWVDLEVVDDGPGVAPADRARIFERFTRLDDARTSDRSGAGLGLPIVAGIVARHGGTVAVDADPVSGGAAFTVRLPAAPGA